MRYLDTGDRKAEHTLARWIEGVVQEQIVEIRIQTGFFSYDAIELLLIPTLEQCRKNSWTTKILIGANNIRTTKDDIAKLMEIIGIPRDNAFLGIVSFVHGFFHPKTYHIRRVDGSQAAFVGSSNMTEQGLSLHVEAGIALDTNEGDDPELLSEIATAIDRWFEEQRDGLTVVSSEETLNAMVESKILASEPHPFQRERKGGADGREGPRLEYLFTPARKTSTRQATRVGTGLTAPAAVHIPTQPIVTPTVKHPSVKKSEFPEYFWFAPDATAPTDGVSALTGELLKDNSVGLIVQLNKDSARHFTDQKGTANISIPIGTVHTLRFGIGGKKGDKPYAEFNLKLRYVSDGRKIDGGTDRTRIIGYGFTKGESGHPDIRMTVPAKGVRRLVQAVIAEKLELPKAGDFALLEWPTVLDPSFCLSFLDTHSVIALQVTTLFKAAITAKQVVGRGACWLTAGISPKWEDATR